MCFELAAKAGVSAVKFQFHVLEDEMLKKTPKSKNFSERNILLVDDVLDNGITLEKTVKECLKVGAKEVHTAVLVEKDVTSRDGLQKADFVGLKLPDRYLFGYGMDFKKYHRNANGIFALAGT